MTLILCFLMSMLPWHWLCSICREMSQKGWCYVWWDTRKRLASVLVNALLLHIRWFSILKCISTRSELWLLHTQFLISTSLWFSYQSKFTVVRIMLHLFCGFKLLADLFHWQMKPQYNYDAPFNDHLELISNRHFDLRQILIRFRIPRVKLSAEAKFFGWFRLNLMLCYL